MPSDPKKTEVFANRQKHIGGSDVRIIMGNDEPALIRLWREKRGEIEREDLSGNLVVQLGLATEDLNRRWYEANTGQVLTDVQRQVRHPALRWMAATLDGRVEATGASLRPSSCCPGRFRKRRRPRNICRSSSTICGWWRRELRCSPSLPVAANGSRSQPMPIRSISTLS